jgi:hypothetical protein
MATDKRREQIRRSVAKWKAAHPERAKEKARRHYQKYAEKYRERARQYYHEHKQERLAYALKRHQATRPQRLAEDRAFAAAKKQKVLSAYGRVCACCGITDHRFLSIDHINGCTKEQRKKEGLGSHLYLYLVKHHFPPGYRTLCFNCNNARRWNGGICPHETGCFAPEHRETSPMPLPSDENYLPFD